MTEWTNEGKDLLISFNLKYEQGIDCGGGYIKILAPGYDAGDWGGDSPYEIMFGPDVCGGTRKTHLIFAYKGKNLERKSQLKVETDELTHVYTVLIRPDMTYEFWLDETSQAKGKLIDDWKFLPAK